MSEQTTLNLRKFYDHSSLTLVQVQYQLPPEPNPTGGLGVASTSINHPPPFEVGDG